MAVISMYVATIFTQQYLRIVVAIILKLRDKSAQSQPLTSRETNKNEVDILDLSICVPFGQDYNCGLSLTFPKEVQSCKTDWVTKQVP